MTKGAFLRTLFEENNTILKWCISAPFVLNLARYINFLKWCVSAPLYQLIAIIDGADTLAC